MSFLNTGLIFTPDEVISINYIYYICLNSFCFTFTQFNPLSKKETTKCCPKEWKIYFLLYQLEVFAFFFFFLVCFFLFFCFLFVFALFFFWFHRRCFDYAPDIEYASVLNMQGLRICQGFEYVTWHIYNPGISRALLYSGRWHIQIRRHIQNPAKQLRRDVIQL